MTRNYLKWAIPALFLCLSFNAHADALENYGYAIHTVDCLQTYEVYHNDHFREVNPLFGNHSEGWIGVCAFGYGLHYLMNKHLAKDTRRQWNWMFAVGKTYIVGHNYQVGVRINF